MGFLTFPDPCLKGSPNEVTLDKMALIASSPTFSDESFIGSTRRSVGTMTVGQTLKTYGSSLQAAVVDLRTPVGGQEARISFDLEEEFPKGTLAVSDRARSTFEFAQVFVLDNDGDGRTATRAEFADPETLDVTFQAVI